MGSSLSQGGYGKGGYEILHGCGEGKAYSRGLLGTASSLKARECPQPTSGSPSPSESTDLLILAIHGKEDWDGKIQR